MWTMSNIKKKTKSIGWHVVERDLEQRAAHFYTTNVFYKYDWGHPQITCVSKMNGSVRFLHCF